MRAHDFDTPTTVTSFTLPVNLLERVRASARRHERTMAAEVRAALRLWLATQQDEAGERS